MAGAISASRNSVIRRRNFSVLAAIQTRSIYSIRKRTTNRHFDLNSCSHWVKIEVKQVDDNDSWLYNENQ